MRTRRVTIVLGLAVAAVMLLSCGRESAASITVYKTPTCGCCKGWVKHLRDAGFEVTAVDMDDLRQVKAERGVPPQLSSCHTAIVEGYVVEGHVPAEDILRLLKERPQVVGLTVPGMPIGSPGMEGRNPEKYAVYTFDKNGKTSHFATHGP